MEFVFDRSWTEKANNTSMRPLKPFFTKVVSANFDCLLVCF